MLRPFLLVGIGGSGGKTLRFVRSDLQLRLEQAGLGKDMPRAWQFLQIDVPTLADGNEPDLPPHLPLDQYRGLVANGLTYRTIDSALAGSGRTKMSENVAGWRPDPAKVNVPVSKGAGQYRAIGRMITVARMDRVFTALQERKAVLDSPGAMTDLRRVTVALGGKPLDKKPEPVVVVVSSIAGGSGAGAVIDVCDALRALGEQWAGESIGFLYAPDVFDHIPQEQRRGVRPNALACLSELLSGYWNSDGPSEQTAALLAKHQVIVGAADRLGPRYPFLVGNRNEHMAFGTQNDIYRAMGRSISAWMTSEPLQGTLGDYIQTNWGAAGRDILDRLPLKLLGTETPFSALGSSNVGLGRHLFRQYAAQALAREAVVRALRCHESQRVQGDESPSKKLIADVAGKRFGAFLKRSELDERGLERNDLLDALRPLTEKADRQTLITEITNKITGEIKAKDGAPLDVVRNRILSELHGRETGFGDQQRTLRLQRARDWVDHIQGHLVRLVATSIATDGGPVTAEMLGKLCTELDFVRGELENEVKTHRRWAGDLRRFESELGGAETLMKNNPLIERAVENAVQTLKETGEAALRDLAVGIIPDLIDNVIKPLANAVRTATSSLLQEESPPIDGRALSVTSWPTDDVVPAILHPAQNEFLIDAVTTYPAELGRLVELSVVADRPGEARQKAIMMVMLDGEDVEKGSQELVALSKGWVPSDYELHASLSDSPTRAEFKVNLGAQEILARADKWVSQKGTAIGDYTGETLKAFLNPKALNPKSKVEDPEQHAGRLSRFEDQFNAALSAAAPLVSINPSVLSQVHGVAEAPYKMYFTGIPFPDRSPARQAVKRVLQARGLWDADAEKALGDGDETKIDIFTVLGVALEPVVFDSIMKPIASEWGSRSEADQRTEFWRWRRARPLTEFLPMSPQIRKSMVRGWFSARVLGQLQLEDDRAAIFVPSEAGAPGKFLDFPSPFLSVDAPHDHDYLPVALVSILLALVEVNTIQSLNPVKPYVRLSDLGRDGRDGGFANYEWAAKELEAWIVDGKTPAGAPAVPATSGVKSDGWEPRRKALEERFALMEAAYRNLFEEVDTRSDVFDVTLAYELRSDILSALGDLQRAVRHVVPKTDVVDMPF